MFVNFFFFFFFYQDMFLMSRVISFRNSKCFNQNTNFVK